jgi:hypothetical protein
MSADAQLFWTIVARSRNREAARLDESIKGLGISPEKGVARMFGNWVIDAAPENVALALQQIAREPSPPLKRLRAAKIAGVWE